MLDFPAWGWFGETVRGRCFVGAGGGGAGPGRLEQKALREKRRVPTERADG